MSDAVGARLARLNARGAALPRAALGDGALVVTDLHLPPEADVRTERFVAWCDGVLAAVPRPSRVVCLGDLFDVWIGRCQLTLSGTAPVADALARLAAAGLAVDVLPGNRDSLLDAAFERRAGVRLRRDGLVLTDAAGTPAVLCLHGDELCVREQGYLRLRGFMRSRGFRALSRVAPLWLARAIARRMRARYSGARGERSPARGPQADAAWAAARGAGATLLVSGHSHAPADVWLSVADVALSAGTPSGNRWGRDATGGAPVGVRWMTLGAFGEGQDVAHLTGGGVPRVLSAAP